MEKLTDTVRHLLRANPREAGATMVEYGLMVALIAVICAVAVALLGTNIRAMLTSTAGSI